MRTLTPDPLLPAPDQVSLVHGRALPVVPSPPTPCASAPAMLPVPGRLGPRFAFPAIGGSSDFVHCSQSRQSHKAVSSLCRGRHVARSSTDQLFTSSCSPRRVAGTQLLSVVWQEAPPGRDSHPPVHARSQAHERGLPSAGVLVSEGPVAVLPRLGAASVAGLLRSLETLARILRRVEALEFCGRVCAVLTFLRDNLAPLPRSWLGR
jgi:hypothetical protein